MKKLVLKNWLGIRTCFPTAIYKPKTLDQLKELVRELTRSGTRYLVVGSSHSYNGIQFADGQAAIVFDGSTLNETNYDFGSGNLTVGPGVTVEKAKELLLQVGRQLPASGNFMKQKLIGAFVTGTHGYGKNRALMADSVVSITVLDEDGKEHIFDETTEELKILRVSFGSVGIIVSATIRTIPLSQYKVKQKLDRLSSLSDILENIGESVHGVSLIPYSDKADPFVGIVEFAPQQHFKSPTKVKPENVLVRYLLLSLVKLVWFIDSFFPAFKPWLQEFTGAFRGRKISDIWTDPMDIDYFYDYLPKREDARDPDLVKMIFDPKYTSNNVAIIVQKERFADLLKAIWALAQTFSNSKPRKYLRDVVGARYIGKSTRSMMAGNYEADSYAVDLFFDPKDLDFAKTFLDELMKHFELRPHYGKTLLEVKWSGRQSVKTLEKIVSLRNRLNPSGLLRPNSLIEENIPM